MRKTVLAGAIKYTYVGTLGKITFKGSYELDFHGRPSNRVVNIWVNQEFPTVHTEEDDYRLMSETLSLAETGGNEDTLEESARETIETYFKEMGVKGVWK